MRPGIWRTIFFGAGHDAQVRAAEGQGQAQRLALGHGDVRAHFAGRPDQGLEHRVGGDDGHGLGLTAGGEQFREVVDGAEEIRVLHQQGGGVAVDGPLEALDVGPAVLVGHGDEFQVQVGRVGAEHDPVDGVQRFGDDDLAAFGFAHGHHQGLVQGGAAVVYRGVGALHSQQPGHGGLVLENRLESALGCFGLIGGVGGVELAAHGQGVHGGGDVVVVEARAKETHAVGGVLGGHGFEPGQDLHLGEPFGEVEALGAHLFRDLGKEVFHGIHADGCEHLADFVVGVRNEWHNETCWLDI